MVFIFDCLNENDDKYGWRRKVQEYAYGIQQKQQQATGLARVVNCFDACIWI
jgi:hypothetical protein